MLHVICQVHSIESIHCLISYIIRISKNTTALFDKDSRHLFTTIWTSSTLNYIFVAQHITRYLQVHMQRRQQRCSTTLCKKNPVRQKYTTTYDNHSRVGSRQYSTQKRATFSQLCGYSRMVRRT